MAVKLNPPGYIPRGGSGGSGGNGGSGGSGGSGGGGGSGGTTDLTGVINELANVNAGLDAFSQMFAGAEFYNKLAPGLAPEMTVNAGYVVDPDARIYAKSIYVNGSLLVRNGGYLMIFDALDVGGTIDNYSVVEVGMGDTM